MATSPRPLGLWLLTGALLVSPLLHLVAFWRGVTWFNLGSRHPWDGFVYLAVAPVVGGLMLARHERARFSAYVFLSCELLRGARLHAPALVLLAVGGSLYLQLPAARRVHPAVDPRKVLARLGVGRRR